MQVCLGHGKMCLRCGERCRKGVGVGTKDVGKYGEVWGTRNRCVEVCLGCGKVCLGCGERCEKGVGVGAKGVGSRCVEVCLGCGKMCLGGRSVERMLGWGWEKGRWGCGKVWEEGWCHDLGPLNHWERHLMVFPILV